MTRKTASALILAALMAAILAACAAPATPQAAPTALPAPTAMPIPTVAPIVIAPSEAPALAVLVSASGELKAAHDAELAFQVQGVVAEVLVAEGAQVAEGQALARLDDADLQLQVEQARAALQQAQAGYEQLIEGATDEEVAAAQAQVAQAQAGLRQARGSVTPEDIAAAQAQVEQARALLARIEAGPRGTDVQSAQAQVEQARANLQLQRDGLSAQKTSAQLQMEQAANQLRDAQMSYSRIYWDNRDLERLPGDLPDARIDQEEAALRAVANAEAALEQARVAFEQAAQAEREGIAAAEAQLAQAQSGLDRLLQGADADELAGARAQLAAAEANLNRLQGDQRAGSLQSAQAGLAGAQANLARITADPTAPTLAGALAQVRSAEVALQQAERTLAKATLRAPFAGVVASLNIEVGEIAGGAPALRLVDAAELYLEVNVSDADITRLRLGQRGEVRIDSLPGELLNGIVSYIAPTASVSGNARTYEVRVTVDGPDTLRAGMQGQLTISEEK